MHQHVEAPPTSEEKEHDFDCFYKGWRDFLEGREYAPPPSWDERERKLYLHGRNNAKEARDLFLEGVDA